jgi:hypothetical protein
VFTTSFTSSPAGGSTFAASLDAVPEPAALTLFTIAACFAVVYQGIRLRRRKR